MYMYKPVINIHPSYYCSCIGSFLDVSVSCFREFKIVDTRDESSLPVKQYQYTDWPEQAVPATGSGIIDLIGQVQKWQRSSGDRPIIIHCR